MSNSWISIDKFSSLIMFTIIGVTEVNIAVRLDGVIYALGRLFVPISRGIPNG